MMTSPRVAVVYFSQTQNTERVARAIAEGLATTRVSTELFDMLETDPRTMQAFDIIGVGTPVFYYREPVVVERFIRGMAAMRGKHAFVFLTSGGHAANTFYHMGRGLERRGLTVIDAFGCHGYDTYPPFKGKGRYEGHPDQEERRGAREFGVHLVGRSDRIRAGEKSLIPKFRRSWDRFGRLAIVFRSELMCRLLLPKKVLHREKCIRCGMCGERCPAGVIVMDPYPEFKRGCIHCTMCERICPVDAIESDWRFIKKKVESYDVPTEREGVH